MNNFYNHYYKPHTPYIPKFNQNNNLNKDNLSENNQNEKDTYKEKTSRYSSFRTNLF